MSTPASSLASTPVARPVRLRDPMVTILRVWGALVFAFLFLPIAYVVIYSFNSGRLLVSWQGFGFDAYQSALSKPDILGSFSVSIRVGVISALVATVLGGLAGIALARQPGRWAIIFSAVLGLTLVTPEIVDAISLLPWMVWLGHDMGLVVFNDGFVRLIVGHSIFSTAVVTFIVRARMSGIDSSLEEAAADLYANPWRRFRQITLPLVTPALLAGGMMAFTLSLDNTIISAFISVSGTTPWPVYVFSSLRSGLRPEIASMSTLMLALTLFAMGMVVIVLRRSGDSSSQIASTLAGV